MIEDDRSFFTAIAGDGVPLLIASALFQIGCGLFVGFQAADE